MSATACVLPVAAFRPWKLSGTVLGVLLNDPATLAEIGQAAHEPPYRAPPRAPVLYVKPRNSLTANGADTRLPDGVRELSLGASLGIVIGRATCRVPEQSAAAPGSEFIAGYTLVADLFVPHASLYRPSVRERAFDASCMVGPTVAPRGALDPDRAEIEIHIDGRRAPTVTTQGLARPAARLLADVSEFMTLHPGDVLLMGVRHDPPRIRAGQRWSIECAGIGALGGTVREANR